MHEESSSTPSSKHLSNPKAMKTIRCAQLSYVLALTSDIQLCLSLRSQINKKHKKTNGIVYIFMESIALHNPKDAFDFQCVFQTEVYTCLKQTRPDMWRLVVALQQSSSREFV